MMHHRDIEHNQTHHHEDPADHLQEPPRPVSPRGILGNKQKIRFLDGLRGLAAILVVTQHSNIIGGLNLGACSVDTFFVLSSFLLTMIFDKKARRLLSNRASRRSWIVALADYFSRRFLRVYPLFFLVALFLWILPADNKKQFFLVYTPQSFDLFKVLTFRFEYRYHVFWTLPLEISYYFLIPFLVVGMIMMRKWWWLPCLPLYICILYNGCYVHRTSHQEMEPHIPTFLAGSLAAIIHNRFKELMTQHQFEFKWFHRLILRSVEYFALAILMSVGFGGLFFTWIHKNPVPQTKGSPFVSFTVTIVILGEMLLPGPVSSILEWSLLRYAGKISYSIYLLHSFVIYSDFVHRQRHYERFFAIFGLTFALSTVSFHLVEHPCQLLATYVGKRLKEYDIHAHVSTKEEKHDNDTETVKQPIELETLLSGEKSDQDKTSMV